MPCSPPITVAQTLQSAPAVSPHLDSHSHRLWLERNQGIGVLPRREEVYAGGICPLHLSHRKAMHAIGKLGERVWRQWDELRHAAAVIGTVLGLCVRPRSWGRTPRSLLARQVLGVGVEPIGFVCAVAVFVGISVVVQLAFWTGEVGQSQLLGPLLVAVVAREL